MGNWIGVFGILIIVVWGETDTGSFGSNGRGHGLDDLKGEAGTVLDGSAVCVCAGVYVIVEELVKKITVATANC